MALTPHPDIFIIPTAEDVFELEAQQLWTQREREYQIALAEWKVSLPNPTTGKKRPKPTISRPRNMYILFFADYRNQENGSHSEQQNLKAIMVSDVWNSMTNAQKEPWRALSQIDKRVMLGICPWYKYKPRGKNSNENDDSFTDDAPHQGASGDDTSASQSRTLEPLLAHTQESTPLSMALPLDQTPVPSPLQATPDSFPQLPSSFNTPVEAADDTAFDWSVNFPSSYGTVEQPPLVAGAAEHGLFTAPSAGFPIRKSIIWSLNEWQRFQTALEIQNRYLSRVGASSSYHTAGDGALSGQHGCSRHQRQDHRYTPYPARSTAATSSAAAPLAGPFLLNIPDWLFDGFLSMPTTPPATLYQPEYAAMQPWTTTMGTMVSAPGIQPHLDWTTGTWTEAYGFELFPADGQDGLFPHAGELSPHVGLDPAAWS